MGMLDFRGDYPMVRATWDFIKEKGSNTTVPEFTFWCFVTIFGTIVIASWTKSKLRPCKKPDTLFDPEQLKTQTEKRKSLLQDISTTGQIEKDTYDDVEPLLDFDWQSKEPCKYRPYKDKYNLTMSIENANVSELIEMDKNYIDRVMLRRRILEEHQDVVLGAYDTVKPAVDELYVWLTGTYLPTRFPRMFQVCYNPTTMSRELWNNATSEFTSLQPREEPDQTLKTLGGLLEDDLLFLLPAEDGDGYELRGFVTCFPNGFNTKKKLGLKLRDIHKPVPGYKEKLEKSMDRWFSRLKAGTYVRRYNWTITPHDHLFTASGNHLYEGEVAKPIEVDIDKTFVRSERQMVHRLPKSQAILFSFKTYLYPIQDIKEEGSGEVLADAIEGLKTGNVPGMHFYKRAVIWGGSVQRYLRS